MIPVSALNGDGVDDLLETLLLVADVEDLRASPDGRAAGVVLESHLDIGRGPVATLLVQRGTLKVGEPLVAGPAWGRVRALIDHRGEQVKEAGPSMPVQVLGLNDVADAGDGFVVAPDERTAKSVAEKREHWHRVANLGREAAAPVAAPASRTSSSRSSAATSPPSTSSSRPTPPARSRRSPRASGSSSATR